MAEDDICLLVVFQRRRSLVCPERHHVATLPHKEPALRSYPWVK